MSVNLAELRKFQDFWGPVLDTIPAVIDMVERKDDLDRSIAAAQREADKVKAHVEDQLRIGTEQIDAAVLRLQETETQRNKVLADIEEARVAAQTAATAAEQAKLERLAVLNSKIVEATDRLNGVEKEFAAKLAQQQVALNDAKAELEIEIAQLETRRDEVQAVIDSLKAKLG